MKPGEQMARKRKTTAIGCLLFILLIGVALLLVWIGVPTLASRIFGEPAGYLARLQKFNFSSQLLIHRNDLLKPVNSQMEEIVFTITPGEPVSNTSRRLEQAGLINNAAGFRAYLVYKGLDSQIKAGDFILTGAMSSIQIAERIQASHGSTVSFYIYPGWRAEEIAAALPSSGIEVDPDEFLYVVHHPELLQNQTVYSEFPSLEGFLYPGVYEIERKISAETLALTFVRRFDENVSDDIKVAVSSHGLSLYQGVTLASIIQRETFKDDERGLMASVFYNRLAIGMKLETDPTVQYALGFSEKWGSWWKTPLLTNDLKVDSPFNTYQIYGLPPAPISNPDLPSILAVAYPDESSYYYFRALCDDSGYHDFSITFEEHLGKSCE